MQAGLARLSGARALSDRSTPPALQTRGLSGRPRARAQCRPADARPQGRQGACDKGGGRARMSPSSRRSPATSAAPSRSKAAISAGAMAASAALTLPSALPTFLPSTCLARVSTWQPRQAGMHSCVETTCRAARTRSPPSALLHGATHRGRVNGAGPSMRHSCATEVRMRSARGAPRSWARRARTRTPAGPGRSPRRARWPPAAHTPAAPRPARRPRAQVCAGRPSALTVTSAAALGQSPTTPRSLSAAAPSRPDRCGAQPPRLGRTRLASEAVST